MKLLNTINTGSARNFVCVLIYFITSYGSSLSQIGSMIPSEPYDVPKNKTPPTIEISNMFNESQISFEEEERIAMRKFREDLSNIPTRPPKPKPIRVATKSLNVSTKPITWNPPLTKEELLKIKRCPNNKKYGLQPSYSRETIIRLHQDCCFNEGLDPMIVGGSATLGVIIVALIAIRLIKKNNKNKA